MNAAGTGALGNGTTGVLITGGASNNTIGGTASGAGNVIGGHSGDGVQIQGSGTTGNVVAGNSIGVGATGTGLISGTVALYRADGNANDAVGGHNGTINGGVTFTPGEIGQAFNFPGNVGFDLVHQLHGFNDAEHLAEFNNVSRFGERRCTR